MNLIITHYISIELQVLFLFLVTQLYRLLATPWAVVQQAPLSMEFFRQEYWSGLPFPSPENLPNPGIEPRSPALQADYLPSETPEKTIL